jgi:hypothetical protein
MSIRSAGRVLGPRNLSPLAGPNSVFRDNVEGLARAESQVNAHKMANQLFYARKSQEGKFYGYAGLGYGGSPEGSYPFISWRLYTQPIYVVPVWQPRVKIWLVNEETSGPEETLREAFEPNIKIQKAFEAVPLPEVDLIPQGQIQSAGTDAQAIIWCPATDELWEIHRLGILKAGSHRGEWKLGYGHYQAEASKWSGVVAEETGGLSASHLSLAHGTLSLGDLVRVLRGGKIGHALAIAMLAVANEHVAPALKNDHQENPYELLEDGKTSNPAFGDVDAIPEGGWYCFPAASRASEYGITNPVTVALYENTREHGIVHTDKGGGPSLSLGDLRTLYTPYCDTGVDGIASSAAKFAEYARANVAEAVWKGWQDPTLSALEGALNGIGGLLWEMPWRTLEQLAPRES